MVYRADSLKPLTLSTREDGLSWAECAGRPVRSSRNTTPRLYTSEEGVKTPVSWYSGSMYLSGCHRVRVRVRVHVPVCPVAKIGAIESGRVGVRAVEHGRLPPTARLDVRKKDE